MNLPVASASRAGQCHPQPRLTHGHALVGLDLEFTTHPCFTSSNTATQKRRWFWT